MNSFSQATLVIQATLKHLGVTREVTENRGKEGGITGVHMMVAAFS